MRYIPSIIFLTLTILLSSCSNSEKTPLYGYIEGRMRFISSPEAGKLTQLFVHRGENVKEADPLFTLEAEPQSLELAAANAALEEAQANLADLEKGLRPTELDQIRAQIQSAEAKVTFARKTYERRKILITKEGVNEEDLDRSIQDLAVAEASIEELAAKLITGKLPAREDQIRAAKARLKKASDQLKQAEWYLSKKSVNAPADGLIFDTYYQPGEEIPANQPILALLPPTEIKAVFFIPEERLSQIKLGQEIQIKCDGRKSTYAGKIDYISTDAEYTPPVIYSRESRSKLVFRVEVEFAPDIAKQLHPGQPIEITQIGS